MSQWNKEPIPKRTASRWLALLFLVAIVVTFIIWVTGAHAQELMIPAIDPDDEPLDILLKLLTMILVTVAIPALGQHFRAKGHEIELKHMTTLQETITNAAALILNKSLTDEEKRTVAYGYVVKNARDAVAYFKLDEARIWTKVEAKEALIGGPKLETFDLEPGNGSTYSDLRASSP